jgi:hypothetical protein
MIARRLNNIYVLFIFIKNIVVLRIVVAQAFWCWWVGDSMVKHVIINPNLRQV